VLRNQKQVWKNYSRSSKCVCSAWCSNFKWCL